MWQQIVIGVGLGFAAAAQPGPLQAYLFSRVAAIGWRRTLPASFAPLLSDGPIALVALFVLGRLSPFAQSALRGAGGVLLLYFAWRAIAEWRRPEAGTIEQPEKTPRTIFEAALVNLLNPNPYIGWTLVLGPMVVTAWRESPANGVAVVVSFYASIVVMLAVSIFAFGSTRLLGPRGRRTLLLVSGLLLAGIGVYQLIVCARYFAGA